MSTTFATNVRGFAVDPSDTQVLDDGLAFERSDNREHARCMVTCIVTPANALKKGSAADRKALEQSERSVYSHRGVKILPQRMASYLGFNVGETRSSLNFRIPFSAHGEMTTPSISLGSFSLMERYSDEQFFEQARNSRSRHYDDICFLKGGIAPFCQVPNVNPSDLNAFRLKAIFVGGGMYFANRSATMFLANSGVPYLVRDPLGYYYATCVDQWKGGYRGVFNSPLRRYAAIANHRQLTAVLNGAETAPYSYDELWDVARKLNGSPSFYHESVFSNPDQLKEMRPSKLSDFLKSVCERKIPFNFLVAEAIFWCFENRLLLAADLAMILRFRILEKEFRIKLKNACLRYIYNMMLGAEVLDCFLKNIGLSGLDLIKFEERRDDVRNQFICRGAMKIMNGVKIEEEGMHDRFPLSAQILCCQNLLVRLAENYDELVLKVDRT